MFFMSFWDLVSSLAIALATVPMPSDVHEVYDFKGSAFGTASTCAIQAFVIIIGNGFTILANCVLNLYYVCTFLFGMTEEKFKKVVLPVSLVLAIAIVIPPATILLFEDLLNPVPFYPYCAVGKYPMICDHDSGNCALETDEKFVKNLRVFLSAGIVIILTSLILVIAAVFKTELQTNRKKASRDEEEDAGIDNDGDGDNNYSEYRETRETLRQAFMYIAAFLMTWGWVFLATTHNGSDEFYNVVDKLKMIFQPLQGFFNAFIFVYIKVFTLRRSDSRLSFWNAVKRVISSPSSVPEMLVSRIDIVVNREDEGSTVDDPGQYIIRRGTLVRRTDEPPVSIPQDIPSDLGSVRTPNYSMVLSEEIKESSRQISMQSGDVGDHKDKDEKKPKRKYYQWSHSAWSNSNKSQSQDSENPPASVSARSNGRNASRNTISSRGNHSTGGLFSWGTPSNRSTGTSVFASTGMNDSMGNHSTDGVLNFRSKASSRNESKSTCAPVSEENNKSGTGDIVQCPSSIAQSINSQSPGANSNFSVSVNADAEECMNSNSAGNSSTGDALISWTSSLDNKASTSVIVEKSSTGNSF